MNLTLAPVRDCLRSVTADKAVTSFIITVQSCQSVTACDAGVMRIFWRERCAYLRKPILHDSIRKGTMNLVTGMSVGITALNYFWFYKMCRGAFKVFCRPSRRQASASASTAALPQVAADIDPKGSRTDSQGGARGEETREDHKVTGDVNSALLRSGGEDTAERQEVVEIPAEEALAHEAA
jgi:hypothetical protein